METDVNLSILQNNLSYIKNYNSWLVEKITNIQEITKPVEFLQAQSGDTILLYNGEVLDDQTDPVDKAEQLFYDLKNNDEDNIYVIFGLGLGYVFKKFVQACKGRVILFEPNIELLRLVFELVDFSRELQKENVFVVNNTKALEDAVNLKFTFGRKVFLTPLDSYIPQYPTLLNEINLSIQKINPVESIEGTFKLNIGAGKWEKEGWKTLDCYLNADIKADLRKCKPLPFKENQVEKVFSSHCIEHIETHHLEHLLKEMYKAMKPGAVIRLACPDADLAFEAYKTGNIKWFDGIWTKGEIGAKLVNTFVSYAMGQGGPPVSEEEVKEKFESLSKDEFIDWCLSLCDRSKPYIAHINGIYYEKLEKLLKNAGFVNIEKSSYKKSKDEELRGPEFDLHPMVSLFVECNKPEV